MTNWWNKEKEEVIESLKTDSAAGITSADAAARLKEYGPNALAEEKETSPWKLFFEQFDDFMIWVLIGAALISGFLQEWVDAMAIIAIVIINAILGFVQEFRAEKSLAALKKMSSPNAKAYRDGTLAVVPSFEIVPGDLVLLEAGDNVPADGRVVWTTTNFSVQEASLTGESTPVLKNEKKVEKVEAPLGDRTNMIYMGTSVTAGKAKAVIVHSGMLTELGHIAGMLKQASKEDTPLQKKLEEFGKWLVYLCAVLVLIVFAVELWRGIQETGALTKKLFVDMFLTAVSLAVAAIPEGLPAVVTIALALGLQRMVKRHVLIRKLPSVETLGCASVICSDKTGTLTRNEMTVQAVYADGKMFALEGVGYAPTGAFLLKDAPVEIEKNKGLKECLLCSALCNGSEIVEKNGIWSVVGDPTEGALLTAAAKGGIIKEKAEKEYAFFQEIPFDSDRKMMTIIRKHGNAYVSITKGAPDVLLKRCTHLIKEGATQEFLPSDMQNLLKVNDELALRALRVLAVAYAEYSEIPGSIDSETMEKNLTFVGFVAMIDPPREEVKAAISECKTAGIKTVMITGDHKNTAVAIAKSLGFFTDKSMAMTGEELDKISDEKLNEIIENTPVYARVSPEHKLRIVKTWRKKGHVAAMTGDGVNDAPAVKEADIGVAMGITGTDVTKEVSDMVVTDDNFASIVAAVEEGRGIYDNIQKFIHYLLSCNAGEILVMFIASLVGMPIPLIPVQLLWVNLITDGLPALALGVDPVAKDIMSNSPRGIHDSVISKQRIFYMLFQGFIIAMCSLSAFIYAYYLEDRHTLGELWSALTGLDWQKLGLIFSVPEELKEILLERARTMGFVVLAFSQNFHSFSCRNQAESLFKIGVFTNKALIWATLISVLLNIIAIYVPFCQTIFKTLPLNGMELMIVLLFSSLPFWIMELFKLITKMTGFKVRM